ncbi:hypothetical protein KFU94_34970 [Chloroflexi bacterium TSY]|nr:hypothetical protein [Chloroflexi bacterium TSY]
MASQGFISLERLKTKGLGALISILLAFGLVTVASADSNGKTVQESSTYSGESTAIQPKYYSIDERYPLVSFTPNNLQNNRRASNLFSAKALDVTTSATTTSSGTLWIGNNSQTPTTGYDAFQMDTSGNVLQTLNDLPLSGIAFDGQDLYFSDVYGKIEKRSADGLTVQLTFTVPVS